MIYPIQLLAIIFGSFALSRAILRFKDKKIKIIELFFWLVLWSGLIFVVFFPQFTSYLAEIVGIGRGIDVIVYSSIGLLFYLIFRLYVKQEEVEMQITKLVREISVQNRKNGRNPKSHR